MAKITSGLGMREILSRRALYRRHFLLDHLGERDLPILEVGALNDPTFRKEEGKVWFADYFTRAESAERHRGNPNHPAERMVDVDFVLRDRRLSEAVTIASGLIIANHVIEHLPDPIRWLQDARKISKVGGLMFLAVPDRRYTFDYFKPVSDAVDWIAAYDVEAIKPTRYQILRGLYYHAALKAPQAWAGTVPTDHMRRFSMSDALEKSADLAKVYTDTHCWVFTYDSLLRVLSDFEGTDLIPWTLVHSADVKRNSSEFHVILEAT